MEIDHHGDDLEQLPAGACDKLSSSTSRREYEVVLSFRGEDTRRNFMDHLYTALVNAGYRAFMDEDELVRGQEISSELERAIRQSEVSIIVFSGNYAFSSWYLDELVKIVDCEKRNNAYGHMVLPVFYDVDPSFEKNPFSKAFFVHEKPFAPNMDGVEVWRAALRETADLAGILVENQAIEPEARFIQNIIKENREKMIHTMLGVEELDDVCLSSRSSMVVPVYSSRISLIEKFKHNRIKSWQKGAFLGIGSFGTVYEGYTDKGLFIAVKEVSLLDDGSQGQESILQLEQEISHLSQFGHENIVQYLGTAKDEDRLYIFLELVKRGSLTNLYKTYTVGDSQVSSYTRQILNGLKYLHERNVIHRNIKCANILVDATGSVKLADFGLAKATKLSNIKSCKGTAYWMAPEVVNRQKNGYGFAADIWSLGCTVLEMLTRQIPYSNLETVQALYRIGKGEPPLVPDSLSRDARDFIYKCLQVNPDNRPTAAQLLEHSFVKRSLQANSSPASPH